MANAAFLYARNSLRNTWFATRIARALLVLLAGASSLPSNAVAQSQDLLPEPSLQPVAQPAGLSFNRFDHGMALTWKSQDGSNFPALRDFSAANALNRANFSAPAPASGSLHASWLAPIASVILPGSGQALLRQQRSLAYVAAEAFLLIQTSRERKDFQGARDRYRNIAADVARVQFGADRPVGPWDYYETMADPAVTASGNYDVGYRRKIHARA